MLKYYYGTMASGKSATLLMNAFQKRTNGSKNKEVLILKPYEERDGEKVTSRVGLESECIVIYPEDNVVEIIYQEIKKKENSLEIFIDECQFLTKEQIHQLWSISRGMNNVNCFGLKNTYKNEVFSGVVHLIAYADEIIKLEPTCTCKYPKALLWLDKYFL